MTAAVDRLASAGVANPAGDAQALLEHARDPQHFAELVDLRCRRVPLAHLLGATRFRGITLEVGSGVFTPQPETSSVVQWAVDAMADRPLGERLMVDLCTGSGTVALALANEIPGAVVHAVERDPAALAWAQRNATARAAAGDPPVQLHLGDAADCLPELDGSVDLVASNPPYVATDEGHIPDPEVTDHDPGIALWAGEDGLDLVRAVERTAARLLKPGGIVVVEHSDRQGITAPAVFEATGDWTDVRDHLDHDLLPRFVTGRRR